MRLFIAINFDQQNKDIFADIQQNLRPHTVSANWVSRDNLHLTLSFLGEKHAQSAAMAALDMVNFPSFNFTSSNLGLFRRDDGDIYWLGIKNNPELAQLERLLYICLGKCGIELPRSEFRPHLTVARKVIMRPDFDRNKFNAAIPQIHQQVDKISLMNSQRIDGKLVYSEVYSRRLS